MGVGARLYMYDVVQKFTFAISSPDEFLFHLAGPKPIGDGKTKFPIKS